MVKNSVYGIIAGIVLVGLIGTVTFSNFSNESDEIPSDNSLKISTVESNTISDEFNIKDIIDSSLTEQNFLLVIEDDELIFNLHLTPLDYSRVVDQSENQLLNEVRLELKPEHIELLETYGADESSVVIYPTFTSAAYSEPGFYTFYRGECNESCITDLSFDNPKLGFTSSGNAVQVLHLFGYNFISDVIVDKNPEILKKYDKIILLHNEYVTKKMFDAVIAHPNIIYLYPNALYAEVEVNHDEKTMTLIRGHDYPPPENPANGFDYEIEQRFHDYEYDTDCIDWEFIEFENGYALNCYPDLVIHTDLDILLKLKELSKK